MLLAKTSFKIEDQWHTWINYDRFHQLVQSGEPFSAYDYMYPTPSWAVFGAEEQGFDPEEERFYRKEGKEVSIRYKPSSSGCG